MQSIQAERLTPELIGRELAAHKLIKKEERESRAIKALRLNKLLDLVAGPLNLSYVLSSEFVVRSVMLGGCANSADLERHEPCPDTGVL